MTIDDTRDRTNVRYLPGADTSLELADPVLEAELVTPEEERELTEREKAIERYRGYGHDVVVAGQVAKRVAKHEVTQVVGRAVVRNVVVYPLTGLWVTGRRVRDRRTTSRLDRVMDTLEAAGDIDRLLEVETRSEQAKQRKHDRRMDWFREPKKFVSTIGWGVAGVFAALLLLGFMLFAASGDTSRILAPTMAVLNIVEWGVGFVNLMWSLLLKVGVPLLVIYLWHVGRRRGRTPTWVAPVAERREQAGEQITPSVVVTALRDLGISDLRNAIKRMDDNGATMLSVIRPAGCGVEVDVTLPSGGDIEQIKARHRKLAGNLNRHPHEVFLTIPKAARTIRMWIADSGALDEPIGPSPLVTDPDATADLYSGRAPWGENLRGERVALSLLQRHLLITGLSNQGKTAALRALVLWLVLDPTVELRIADLKGIGDWRMFSPIATRFVQGPTDEHVAAATEMLEEGVREMNRRLAAVEATGSTDGVTREMARSGQGLHPIFLIVDEAQVAYMCPAADEYGSPYGGQMKTSRYFMAARYLHNQGRAVNVILWQGTQDPTNQNLPVLVREGAHIRASLVVGTESQSRMALGDKAVNLGAAPHKLRQGLDKGTLVVAGDGVDIPDGQPSITVRTHYIDGATAADLAKRVAERRERLAVEPAEQQRDLLADVAAVLHGEDLVKATDACARLRDLAPTYLPYHGMSAQALAGALGRAGVQVRPLDGYLTVRSERVHAALAARAVETPENGQ
jgi:S-DNA-T family DNA segregation ATPase FtsK/SpoIIIE